MQANDNILDLLREKGAEAARQAQRAVILQPGAIGDCILTLPRGRELLKEIPAALGFDQAHHRRVDFSKKLVVIHPGSGGLQKCWHLDNFLALAKKLISRGIEVIFLLGPAELARFSDATINQINSVAKCLTDLSFTQALELLSCADEFVGNDSGITHLAAALGVRTLAVFGPTNPAVYKPIGPAVTVFASGTKAFAKKPSAKLQQQLLDVLTV